MFCKSCGQKIDDDSIFCSYCGIKQSYVNKQLVSSISVPNTIKDDETVSTIKTTPKVPQYDLSYKKEIWATVLGIILVIIYIVISLIIVTYYSDTYNSFEYDYYGVICRIIFVLLHIHVMWIVYNIAKRQNRKVWLWGILGLFFPAIILIIIGQLKKLYKEESNQNKLDINQHTTPDIKSYNNFRVKFSDDTIGEVINDKDGRYYIYVLATNTKHYYKSKEAAFNAAYIYAKTKKISEIDLEL